MLGKSPDCCGTNSYLKELSTTFWKLKTLKYRCWVTAQMSRGFQLAAVAFGEEKCLHYPKPHSVSRLLGTVFLYLSRKLLVFDHTPYQCTQESKTTTFQMRDLDLTEMSAFPFGHWTYLCKCAYIYAHTRMCAYVFAQQGAVRSENNTLFPSPGCNIVALVEIWDRSIVRSARKALLEQVMWL